MRDYQPITKVDFRIEMADCAYNHFHRTEVLMACGDSDDEYNNAMDALIMDGLCYSMGCFDSDDWQQLLNQEQQQLLQQQEQQQLLHQQLLQQEQQLQLEQHQQPQQPQHPPQLQVHLYQEHQCCEDHQDHREQQEQQEQHEQHNDGVDAATQEWGVYSGREQRMREFIHRRFHEDLVVENVVFYVKDYLAEFVAQDIYYRNFKNTTRKKGDTGYETPAKLFQGILRKMYNNQEVDNLSYRFIYAMGARRKGSNDVPDRRTFKEPFDFVMRVSHKYIAKFDDPPLNPTNNKYVKGSVSSGSMVTIEGGEAVPLFLERVLTHLFEQSGDYVLVTSGPNSIYEKCFVPLVDAEYSKERLKQEFNELLILRYLAQRNKVGPKFLFYSNTYKDRGATKRKTMKYRKKIYDHITVDPHGHGADHAELEECLHHTVATPVPAGTVLVMHEGYWKYAFGVPYAEWDMVGVVSKKAFHYLRKADKGQFHRVVIGTCPARVLEEQVKKVLAFMKTGKRVYLCVTQSTKQGYMEIYADQEECEVVGYVGNSTRFNEEGVPSYQEEQNCFHLDINQETPNMLLKVLRKQVKYIAKATKSQDTRFWLQAFIIVMLILYQNNVNRRMEDSITVCQSMVAQPIEEDVSDCASCLVSSEPVEALATLKAMSMDIYNKENNIWGTEPFRSGGQRLCQFLNNRSIRSDDMSSDAWKKVTSDMERRLGEYIGDPSRANRLRNFEDEYLNQLELIFLAKHSVNDEKLLLREIKTYRAAYDNVCGEQGNNLNECFRSPSLDISSEDVDSSYQGIYIRLGGHVVDAKVWNEERLEIFEKDYLDAKVIVLKNKYSVEVEEDLLTRIQAHWPTCWGGDLVSTSGEEEEDSAE